MVSRTMPATPGGYTLGQAQADIAQLRGLLAHFAASGIFTNGVKLNNSQAGACTLFSGSGAPAAGLGISGDYYLRSDTPGTANQRIYVNNAGTWTGIV